MKAISLHPEHAMNVAEGQKWIETRPRRCNYTGRIAVHATLPLGAVVASAVLTDCVPIVGAWPDSFEPYVYVEGGARPWRLAFWANSQKHTGIDMSDQLPFGDFSPGRWALLLDDIAPTTERCPWCWTLRSKAEWVGATWVKCPVCDGGGHCDPVPARGQQAVPWEWTP